MMMTLMNTKKKLILFCLVLAVIFSAFASDMSLSFDVGIDSGIPFYGDKNVKELNDSLNDGGNRIVIGMTTDINLRIVKYLTGFFGMDLLCDYNWRGNEHFNHLDIALFPGVKIYPGIGGLNISFAYAIGTRFDFSSISSNDQISYYVPAWGNGIRLGLEYNFYYKNKTRFLPSVGAYWRWIPRGNYQSDNVLGVYALVNF